MKKILIISEFFIPYYYGGGEIRYYEIAKKLIEKGYKVDLICMKIKNVPLKEKIDGINVYHIGPKIKNPPKRNILDFLRFMYSVYKWLSKNKYDVVDAQTYSPLIPLYFSYKFKKQKNIVATIHDTSFLKTKKQWISFSYLGFFIERFIYRLPYKKIITVSNEMKKKLVKEYKVNEKRINVIHNGVNLKLIKNIKAKTEKNRIIFVGRLIPHKHVEDLIKAIAIIRKKIKNIKLVIIGDGIMKEKLVELTKRLKLNKNIIFLGTIKEYKNVLKEIKKSNILVLPSTREGFGLVLAEANALGKPVIAYNIGGVKDVVIDGYNGFLVKPLSIKELSNKILLLLKDKKLYEKMGENGRKRVFKNFNWDSTTKKLIKIYFD